MFTWSSAQRDREKRKILQWKLWARGLTSDNHTLCCCSHLVSNARKTYSYCKMANINHIALLLQLLTTTAHAARTLRTAPSNITVANTTSLLGLDNGTHRMQDDGSFSHSSHTCKTSHQEAFHTSHKMPTINMPIIMQSYFVSPSLASQPKAFPRPVSSPSSTCWRSTVAQNARSGPRGACATQELMPHPQHQIPLISSGTGTLRL